MYHVLRQLTDYLQSADLLPVNQSRFRPGHSAEIVVLQALADILLAVDDGDVASLMLLDLSTMRSCNNVYKLPMVPEVICVT